MTPLAGACVAACLLASCGGSDGDSDGGSAAREQIETTVRDLQRAFVAGNSDRVCALLSAAARKHVEGMGHDLEGRPSEPCYIDLFMFVEGVRKSPDWRSHAAREIDDVEIDGDRATATVRFEDGQTASLPLVKEEGRWRVDALYGGIPAERQEDHY